MNEVLAGCGQPGCAGPAGGICINKLAFSDCPDVLRIEQVPPQEPLRAALSVERVGTGGCGAMDNVRCDAFLRRCKSSVVAIVAPPEAGKTTLLATMYEMAWRGRLKKYRFAGSETLRGFEERAFLARVASGASHADTPRTSQHEMRFLHLELMDEFDQSTHLVVSDRSGENFEAMLNEPASISSFQEIQRAKTLLLLVDMQAMAINPARPSSTSRRLALAIAQNDLFRGKRMMLVGTKSDLLEPQQAAQVGDELTTLAASLDTRDWGLTSPIGVHVTASRARKGSTEIGFGLDTLIDDMFAIEAIEPASRSFVPPRKGRPLDRLMDGFR